MYRDLVSKLVLTFVPLLTLAGCGSDGYSLAPVSGRVTVDGEPVLGLRVSFEPIGGSGRPLPGPESMAVTDADGKYVLYTIATDRRGAVIGDCRVRILALPSNALNHVISDDRDPNYDPVAEIKAINAQIRRGKQKATAKEARPTGLLPLRFNDRTELKFTVTPDGSDKADFAISWK